MGADPELHLWRRTSHPMRIVPGQHLVRDRPVPGRCVLRCGDRHLLRPEPVLVRERQHLRRHAHSLSFRRHPDPRALDAGRRGEPKPVRRRAPERNLDRGFRDLDTVCMSRVVGDEETPEGREGLELVERKCRESVPVQHELLEGWQPGERTRSKARDPVVGQVEVAKPWQVPEGARRNGPDSVLEDPELLDPGKSVEDARREHGELRLVRDVDASHAREPREVAGLEARQPIVGGDELHGGEPGEPRIAHPGAVARVPRRQPVAEKHEEPLAHGRGAVADPAHGPGRRRRRGPACRFATPDVVDSSDLERVLGSVRETGYQIADRVLPVSRGAVRNVPPVRSPGRPRIRAHPVLVLRDWLSIGIRRRFPEESRHLVPRHEGEVAGRGRHPIVVQDSHVHEAAIRGTSASIRLAEWSYPDSVDRLGLSPPALR